MEIFFTYPFFFAGEGGVYFHIQSVMVVLPIGTFAGHDVSRLLDPVFFGRVLIVAGTLLDVDTGTVVVLYLSAGTHTSGHAFLFTISVGQLLISASSVTDFGAVCIH